MITDVNYLFNPPAPVSVPIANRSERFPIHRIYGLARNHADHAIARGFSGQDPPFFFLKQADAQAVVVAEANQLASLRYPSLTQALYHEIELVVAIGAKGKNIDIAQARQYIFGYAVGIDLSRHDLLYSMARQGRPWCMGKSFDHAAVVGPITAADQAGAPGAIDQGEISLHVNGVERQRGKIAALIWNAAKIIEQLSLAWELQPGDLIYTGTPKGSAAVSVGDILDGEVTGLCPIKVQVSA